MGWKLQPQRIAGGVDEFSKDQSTDKNFDDVFGAANKLDRRVSALEKNVSISSDVDILSIVMNIEADAREFALMVGYE